jgi:hypothetical protein
MDTLPAYHSKISARYFIVQVFGQSCGKVVVSDQEKMKIGWQIETVSFV